MTSAVRGAGPGQRHALCLALLFTLAGPALQAQDSQRGDWLRNPAMGNYKAYAEFKMARYAQAREVWETLAGIGNGDALFNLGILAEDGLDEPKNMAKAEALYASAAQAGNFKARYRLGMLYSAGVVLPRDVEKARLYLTMAAEGGDKDALATLAALEQPAGTPSRFRQAEWLGASARHAEAAAVYRELADAGDRQAQTRLAWMHEAGRGVVRDLDEAARRFEIAATAGDAEAQYALAVMLRTGKGHAQDRTQSRLWLQRAAGQHHPAALAALNADDNQDKLPN
ncbi:MAG: sel1 repeat family protein [Polaromonas sp.]|nr:sel1 repeat family protein [Polaromonas sp.]